MFTASHPASRKSGAKFYSFHGRYRKDNMTYERFHRIKKRFAETDRHIAYSAFHNPAD